MRVDSRNRFHFIFISIILCVMSVVLAFGIKIKTYANEESTEYNYISIEIQKGDTLTKIANCYSKDSGISSVKMLDEIIRINKLANDNISAGSYIVIPIISK